MKNLNFIITGLIMVILFLGYQVIDLKQEITSIRNVQQPQIHFPDGFAVYGQSSSGINSDGFWLYKDDEKILYLFKYDPTTNEISKIQRNLYDQ
ncbi:hypothetical protein [Paenibacillus dakarensis]|uniref:hypothetical protein n=1 Tax=Paenibacillus dakarensis TaxID=1527293 RepID=UPI0006D59ED1|nr:hypothetical protein [Paenibacillus dakarensis]